MHDYNALHLRVKQRTLNVQLLQRNYYNVENYQTIISVFTQIRLWVRVNFSIVIFAILVYKSRARRVAGTVSNSLILQEHALAFSLASSFR